MAEIVIGIGTSHSPQLSITPDKWEDLGELDRNNAHIPFAALAAERGAALAPELTPESWRTKFDACQQAIDRLGEYVRSAQVDVLVIVGDDQEELWGLEGQPAIAVFCGETLWDLPVAESRVAPAYRPGLWAWHNSVPEPYQTASHLGRQLVATLSGEDFDLTQFSQQIPGRPLGHAFTFLRRRLKVPASIPMLPVILNAHVPPNFPSATRCWNLGRSLARAIAGWPDNVRVGLVASGGLTHWLIDEKEDRWVLDAILDGHPESLQSLTPAQLTAGSSEIRSWIAVAAAIDHLKPELVDYVPAYRSAAGTGVGMGFMVWH